MQLFRLVLVLLAGAAVAGQLLQERYRLSVIEKLPADQALARYQASRRRGERGMVILTAVSGLIGLAALLDLVIANLSQR
ncbi:MAG TPA: hypothetical protein VGG33_27830 [Polyangia bacterium]